MDSALIGTSIHAVRRRDARPTIRTMQAGGCSAEQGGDGFDDLRSLRSCAGVLVSTGRGK